LRAKKKVTLLPMVGSCTTTITIGDVAHVLAGIACSVAPSHMMRELLQFTAYTDTQAIMCGRIIQAGFGGLKAFSIVRTGLAA
jgi:hypothetical protein